MPQRGVAIPGTEKPSAGGPGGGRGRGRGKGKRGGRREEQEQNVSKAISQRRGARDKRKAERAIMKELGKDVKSEIIEVGKEGMSVGDLAEALAINDSEVIKILFLKGVISSVNQTLDLETVKLVCEEEEVEVLDKDSEGFDTMAKKTTDWMDEADLEFLVTRPPVVTVMGHVDHGKTSLLDCIRKAKVAEGEAGGITQGIGAYRAEVATAEEGVTKTCVFLDTPGHEAFSAMRARGARVTDIAIIVVAADDGVRPQTKEAVAHAQAAGVPIVVAINKCDKEGANASRVINELAELELVPEAWGGNTPMIEVSAKKGTGIDDLLENVLLVAEMADLQANPAKPAQGTVIEGFLDKNRGPVATLLIQAGTLKEGDCVTCGAFYGKVRTLVDDLGQTIGDEGSGPSMAVQMLGLDGVPIAGTEFKVVETEQLARQMASTEADLARLERIAEQAGGGSMVTLHSLELDDEEEVQRMNVILKTDTAGAVEAIKAALAVLPQDRVALRFLLATAGEISQSDVDLASASQGVIIGFGIEPPEAVRASAKSLGVQIRTYDVIYSLLDEIKADMEGKLLPVIEKDIIGTATVKAIFGGARGKVAGCMVDEGKIRKGARFAVLRGKKNPEYEGTVDTLRRFTDNVSEVVEGDECGMGCLRWNEWKEGDKVEIFYSVERMRTLEDTQLLKEKQLAAAAEREKKAKEAAGV